MSKPERDAINAEFARLYPDWPSNLKLTAAKKQQMIDTWRHDMARSAEILAY